MSRRSALRALLVCSLGGLCVPFPLGLTYTERLAARTSLYPVSVPDQVARPDAVRPPRRAVLVVLDGLGYQEALGMRSAQLLRERGQCWKTDVGSLPLSRPVYGVLSTGVEQDRGGALTNEATTPHGAESVWEIARAAGRTVAAVSELRWWQDLFPRGFSTYLMLPQSADYFRLAPRSDLLLIHPVYIDEIGHSNGADSAAYRAAVSRADGEILGFLSTVDLDRDLIVITADHGHSARGGHGGTQDRISHVLSCFAGTGVRHRAELGALRMTSLAPSLALLLGLRFPAGMRAGDDDLGSLGEIADPGAFPPGYLDERRQAVERFRAANRAQLARWEGVSGGSWAAFYALARWRCVARALPFVGLLGLLLGLHRLGHRRLQSRGQRRFGFLFGLLWLVSCAAATCALQAGLRGSFDMSSVNNRLGFIHFTLLLGGAVGIGAPLLHLLLRRSVPALLWDMSILSVLETLLCLAHPIVFGWHIRFPVPPPWAFFFPYFAALFLTAQNGIALLLCLLVWPSERWPRLSRAFGMHREEE